MDSHLGAACGALHALLRPCSSVIGRPPSGLPSGPSSLPCQLHSPALLSPAATSSGRPAFLRTLFPPLTLPLSLRHPQHTVISVGVLCCRHCFSRHSLPHCGPHMNGVQSVLQVPAESRTVPGPCEVLCKHCGQAQPDASLWGVMPNRDVLTLK